MLSGEAGIFIIIIPIYVKKLLSEFIFQKGFSISHNSASHPSIAFIVAFFFGCAPWHESSSPARDQVHAASNGESKPLDCGKSVVSFQLQIWMTVFQWEILELTNFIFCLVYNIELNTSGDVKFSLLIILTKKLNPRETKQLFSHLKRSLAGWEPDLSPLSL